jgi:hypothetical protein
MSWLSELGPIVIAWLMALSAVAVHLFKRWGRGGENRYLLLAVAAFLLVALASNGLFGLLLSMLAIGFCIVIGRGLRRSSGNPSETRPGVSRTDDFLVGLGAGTANPLRLDEFLYAGLLCAVCGFIWHVD